jgi:hypothetical protein
MCPSSARLLRGDTRTFVSQTLFVTTHLGAQNSPATAAIWPISCNSEDARGTTSHHPSGDRFSLSYIPHLLVEAGGVREKHVAIRPVVAARVRDVAQHEGDLCGYT